MRVTAPCLVIGSFQRLTAKMLHPILVAGSSHSILFNHDCISNFNKQLQLRLWQIHHCVKLFILACRNFRIGPTIHTVVIETQIPNSFESFYNCFLLFKLSFRQNLWQFFFCFLAISALLAWIGVRFLLSKVNFICIGDLPELAWTFFCIHLIWVFKESFCDDGPKSSNTKSKW